MTMITTDLFKKYIKGTEKKAVVQMITVLLCTLTSAVTKGIKSNHNKIYINTRVIKHIYDKRPAEEFDFLILNIGTITKYPDFIYTNKLAKRGTLAFVKELKNKKYFCSVEEIQKENEPKCFEVVTFFRTDDDYLENYELLWKWEGGDLHRSTFDSGLTQPSSTLQ